MPPGAGALGGPGLPPGSGSFDLDASEDLATLVVVVLEVTAKTPGYVKNYEAGAAIPFGHKWGSTYFVKQLDKFEVNLVPAADGRPLPTVRERFSRDFAATMNDKDKMTPENLLSLARKALNYGLVDRYSEVMNKLAEIDKTSPLVKRYLQVKEMLAKPMPPNDLAEQWKTKVLEGYRVVQKSDNHFALLHPYPTDEVPEVKAKLERLQNTLRGIYFWWAMQEKAELLPLPKQRLLSVLTDRGEDFNKLKKQFASSPILSDSFLARREGVSVFSTRRGDEHYEKMESASDTYWKEGYHRTQILKGTGSIGLPRGKTHKDLEVYAPRTSAIVLKALEDEWEQNASSHEVARQLPFATGLIAAKVHAPEWIQFGMGSLFERPLQAPWSGIGVANSYYLPRFREYLKAGKFSDEKSFDRTELLIRVVTDELFHAKPGKQADGKPETTEAVQRRARSAAWALTYYLAKNDMQALQAYFKELSKLPRDVELDRELLLQSFAKATRCVDASGQVNRKQLDSLAMRWLAFIDKEQMEGQKIHDAVRKAYETVRKNPPTSPGGPNP
ncbi:MAG: DUF1570 domain-containing protein, partial [Verrucomicrobiia bacterium]